MKAPICVDTSVGVILYNTFAGDKAGKNNARLYGHVKTRVVKLLLCAYYYYYCYYFMYLNSLLLLLLLLRHIFKQPITITITITRKIKTAYYYYYYYYFPDYN